MLRKNRAMRGPPVLFIDFFFGGQSKNPNRYALFFNCFYYLDVWRFPFTAYENGGGAFLIPYLIILIFIGRPLYFLELAMGQFSSKSSVKVWDLSPIFRGMYCCSHNYFHPDAYSQNLFSYFTTLRTSMTITYYL